MSLLLDALRKSEAQRRAGETPGLDLGSSDAPTAGGRRGRSGERLGWLLVLLVVLGGGAGLAWWQPWAPWQSTSPRPSEQVAESASVTESGTRPGSNIDAPAPVSPAPVESVVDSGAATDPDPEPKPPARRSEMTEGEATSEPVDGPGPGTRSPARVAAAEKPADETPASEDRVAGNPAPDDLSEQSLQAEATAVSVAEPAAAVAEAPVADKDPPATAPQRDASLDGVIRPWELPQELRAEFPELRLTVHFYAAQPADRFVLIDGERRGEGDSLGGGARIAEIRKRGLIVDFQRYRILIE